MSFHVQLESKQKLPQKVTDVICDLSMMMNNAISTSNSNELMSSSFKAIVGSETTIENSSKTLDSITSLLGDMESKFSRDGPLEFGVMKLSDAQESLLRLEKCIYGEEKAVLSEEKEEWRRRAKDEWREHVGDFHDDWDDGDYLQMIKDRELLPENDELLMSKFDAEMEAKKKENYNQE